MLYCQLLALPRDTPVLPSPWHPGEREEGQRWTAPARCSLLHSSTVTLKMISDFFSFCAPKILLISRVGERSPNTIMSVKRWETFALFVIISVWHPHSTVQVSRGTTYLWKLGRFSTQWQPLLGYTVPVLIPYRTGAFQQWLKRECRE